MTIGKINLAATAAPGSVLDVDRLIVSRMLIQGGSGSGKSTLARQILEQTAGKLQQIIIDPEGEFSTMRQVGDYLLCSADGAGDVLAVPKAANLLARKIRETGVSAVIDVYDLKPGDRKAFVARFLEGLIAAPKKYYRDSLVFIDEAHMFAPQSQSAESLEAVQDMAARSRKRKLGLICATQRLSKFHKDVVAELQNRIIGQVGLKNDLKSAAEEMGLSFQEAREALLRLKPGQFWTFGPALAPEFTVITAAMTKTKAATADTKPAKASGSLEKVIEALGDLPAQAAKEARTLADLQGELAAAKGEIRRLEREGKKPAAADPEQLAAAKAETARIQKHADELAAQLTRVLRNQKQAVDLMTQGVNILGQEVEIPKAPQVKVHITGDVPGAMREIEKQIIAPRSTTPAGTNGKLSGPQQKILNALAWWEAIGVTQPEAIAVAMVTGYRNIRSGGFKNPRSELASMGLVEYPVPGLIALTAAGRELAEFPDLGVDGPSLRARVLERLSGPQRRILQPLLDAYPEVMPQASLAEAAGYTNIRSGGFKNPRSELASMGLVEYPQAGYVRARDILFP